MPKVRPLEVQDLFLALAACPMSAGLRTESGDAVVGLDPYGQDGPVLLLASPEGPGTKSGAFDVIKKLFDERRPVAEKAGDDCGCDLDLTESWPILDNIRALLRGIEDALDAVPDE